MDNTVAAPRHGNRYMMAAVLGTALTVLSPAATRAAETQAGPGPSSVANLSRYCTACWRNARLPVDTWNDCTQDVLTRLLQRIPGDAWDRALALESGEHRELVRAIDAVKKRVQRRKKYAASPLDLVPDQRDYYRKRIDEERTAVGKAAASVLSPRQQQIVRLSLEGYSVQDISTRLELPPERISDEKYKAIRKLRTHLIPEA